MRICLLSSDFGPDLPPGQGGGIETYVRAVSRGLAARGHDVHLVLPTTGATRRLFVDDVQWHAIRVPDVGGELLPDHPETRAAVAFAWQARRKVRTLMEEDGPFDIIEAPEYKGQGAYLARDSDVMLVVKCHAHLLFCLEQNGVPLSDDTASVALLERDTLRAARAVNANSRFLADRCARDYALSPEAIDHVPYGIDTDLFRPTPSSLRAELGLGTGPVLLFAGRLEERKGLSVVVDAFARLAATRPDVVLLLAGGDVAGADQTSNQAWMRREWQRHGLSDDRYRMLGVVPHDRMPALFSVADVLVAPAPFEAFGFVYLEAAACGCLPLGCTTGGAAEVIAHGETGWLVPPRDAQALATAIRYLLDRPDLRQRLTAAGRARVSSAFSLPAMVARTERFYEARVA